MSLLCANLDFEYAWSAAKSGFSYQMTPPLRALCQRWSSILRLLPGQEDAICLQPGERGWCFPNGLLVADGAVLKEEVLCWGHSPVQARWPGATPEGLSVIAEANSKQFSHELEKELGVALPGARLLHTREEFEAAIAETDGPWVVKHPWGVSGRERIQGKAGHVETRHVGWLDRQFRKGWTLVFEPWLAVEREFSMHYSIETDGSAVALGTCLLMAGRGGTFRGNGCVSGVAPWMSAEASAVGLQVAERLAALGVRGPVGIDAMWGEWAGQRVLRPLMEINARVSFGRLTLALSRWVPAGWSWSWWHPTAAERKQLPAVSSLPALGESVKEEGLYRLPECADPDGASGTMVWCTPASVLPDPPYQ